MNKQAFIDEVLKESKRQLKELKSSLETTRQAAIDAPGPMQSKSDTSKHQLSQLASNLESSRDAIEKLIVSLNSVNTTKVYDKIQVGAIVEIQENSNVFFVMIVPPGGGGHTIELEGHKTESVSFSSPLAKALLNKKAGDMVKVKVPAGIRILSVINVI